MQGDTEERPLGQLLSDLSRQFTTLVRQEVELAKTEMTAKASKAGRDIGFLVAGGAVAYAGGLVLLAALVLVLVEIGLPGWLAATLVGLVVAGAGAFLVMRGRDALQREDLTPHRTIQTLKEDAEWARDQTASR
jgi:hypothetical protein